MSVILAFYVALRGHTYVKTEWAGYTDNRQSESVVTHNLWAIRVWINGEHFYTFITIRVFVLFNLGIWLPVDHRLWLLASVAMGTQADIEKNSWHWKEFLTLKRILDIEKNSWSDSNLLYQYLNRAYRFISKLSRTNSLNRIHLEIIGLSLACTFLF